MFLALESCTTVEAELNLSLSIYLQRDRPWSSFWFQITVILCSYRKPYKGETDLAFRSIKSFSRQFLLAIFFQYFKTGSIKFSRNMILVWFNSLQSFKSYFNIEASQLTKFFAENMFDLNLIF